MAELHTRAYFAQAISGKPMKFHGHLIPEFFTCTFYIIDNDGIKVTDQNFKTFKTWTLELTLKTSASETVEIIGMSAQGAKKFTGQHVVISTKPKEIDAGTLTARHFNLIQENRAKLIGYSATAIIRTTRYEQAKDGGHKWTIGDRVEISESELQELYSQVVDSSYTKLTGSFYQEFAERYKALILEGEKHPIKTLQRLYYPFKSVKHVQSYATEARKRGLLAKPETTKNSPVRNKRKKGR